LGRTKFSLERLKLHHLPHTTRVGCIGSLPVPSGMKRPEGVVVGHLVPST
jgi:hypothetical protein